MKLFDEVKKLRATCTNNSPEGIVDVDVKGSIFGKSNCKSNTGAQLIYNMLEAQMTYTVKDKLFLNFFIGKALKLFGCHY